MLGRAGLPIPLGHLEVVLPIGISFYTFQSMSYVIDVYRREIKPTRNLVQFAVFVSFFPHLVAGPIMRPRTLLPQVASRRRFNLQQFYGGVYLIFWGLFEKVVVADNLAIIVNDLFGRWEALDGGLALAGGLRLRLSDLRRLFGIHRHGPRRGQVPGFRASAQLQPSVLRHEPTGLLEPVAHQSVAVVARLPVHPPGREPRRHACSRCRNVMLTMILGGLWHGARWTFVCWGLYQGLLLVLHRLAAPWLERIQPADPIDRACWTGLRIIVTFHLVCLGWLMFRADSMEQAAGMLAAIVQRPAIPAAAYLVPVALTIIPLLFVQFVQYAAADLDVIGRTPWYVRSVFYTACFYAIVLVGQFGGEQFIYFQF